MSRKTERSINRTQMILTAGLLLTMMVLLFSTSGPSPKAQPQLVDLSLENPSQMVRLIVQKAAENNQAEVLVAELGGEIVSDLSMIHAFSAEMTAADAVTLSRSSAVRWVSLDAQVEGAGKPPPKDDPSANNPELITISEIFNQVTYSGGSQAWTTDWVEDDPNGEGALGGSVYVADGGLRMHDSPDLGTTPSVYREFDLSHALTDNEQQVSAAVFFHFGPGVQAGQDIIVLEVSADGGLTYDELFRFDNYEGGSSGMEAPWFPEYVSPHTRLRFRVLAGYDDPDDYFSLDSIQIGYYALPLSEGEAYNYFLETLGVPQVWDMGYDGSGIGVAVIDSGISKHQDFGGRVRKQISFNANSNTVNDTYGHGTHVAGIIGGLDETFDGRFTGVAPGVDLYSLKINDETGMAYESDLVAALQWVYDNKDRYNIRIVNLSVNSSVESSYHASHIDAAVEILWFNGVVVVTSAGNYWDGSDFNPVLAAPANDPFVITVGATDDKGTVKTNDDVQANYSAFGNTVDGYFKPELYAPGTDIISVLSGNSDWDLTNPERVVMNGDYFRLSGSSMAAPMVTGALALLLDAEPDLTPDQVKFRLLDSAEWIGPSLYLNVYNLLTSPTTESANTGLEASQLLWSGDEPVVWGSVAWNSVAWNSVAWNSVAWNSVAWNSVAWNSVAWNSVAWNE